MKVFVSGTFDMLHSGHITFLREASQYGELYVGIGSDYSIKKYKGNPPVCNQDERLFMIKSIRYVKNAYINTGEGQMDFTFTMSNICPDRFICNEEQDTEDKREFCKEIGVDYIVLKRTQYGNLPARSTTQYRKI
jgi:cytidyltransferase-like protein